MEAQFWSLVDSYTDSRWWFGAPAPLVAGIAALVLLLAALRLHKRSTAGIVLAAIMIGVAIALLLPSSLLAWRPLDALGIDPSRLTQVPTATYPAVAGTLDRAMQMGYIGGGVLLVGALSALGALGARRGNPCPNCTRDRHPGWKGICPECRLMEPRGSESALMRLGDHSASGLAVSPFGGAGVPITQFGVPAHTELLESGAADTAWVEVIQAPDSVGERFAVGARLTIGRDPNQCQLVLDDDAVSARHAYIERENQAFVLYDWGSRNGTRVNDETIGHRALRDGDLVSIGRAQLRFVMPVPAADSAPTMLMLNDMAQAAAQLILIDGDAGERIFPIARLDTRIGRGRQNDIIIDAPTVSRHHASVCFDGSGYYLVDAGSPNGTWIDEARVLGTAPLRPGQVIRMGEQRLRFELKEAADGTNG